MTAATRVKFCGVTSLDDAVAAVELDAWAIGLIFHPRSPRACDPGDARRIGSRLRREIEIAGVFVNSTLDEIAVLAEGVPLSLVQLHGDEGPSFASEVARRTGARVIKAHPARDRADLRDMDRFHTPDFHLLDSHRPGMRGGTGTTFDWALVAQRSSKNPLIVSGGLTPDNVAEAIVATSPYAVDVASGVESSPGVKDHALMEAFVRAAGVGVEPEPEPEVVVVPSPAAPHTLSE
jgi:phosphoribosylanthranilate isomerase